MPSINLLLGADPELFVRKANGSRAYVSAHGLIPGTKEEPFRVECGAIQVDGMAVEYNIDPASNAEEFYQNNMTVLSELKKIIGPKYELVAKPWAKFGRKVWETAPDEAKVLGCNPDYNAYTGQTNEPPNAELDFRTASGHLHIGWTQGADVNDPGHFSDCCMLAKELDATLGLSSLILDPSNKRRLLYGKAGAIRVKPYGMEYRVLSNFWVGKDLNMHKWIHQQVVEAFNRLVEGREIHRMVWADRLINTVGKVPYGSIEWNLRRAGVDVDELPK